MTSRQLFSCAGSILKFAPVIIVLMAFTWSPPGSRSGGMDSQEQQLSAKERLLKLLQESESAKARSAKSSEIPATRKPNAAHPETQQKSTTVQQEAAKSVAHEVPRTDPSPASGVTSVTRLKGTDMETTSHFMSLPTTIALVTLVGGIIFITIQRKRTMQWLYDLNIATKLLGGFVFVALIAAVVGYTGIRNLETLSKADKNLYEFQTVGVGNIGDVAEAFYKARYYLLNLAIAKTPEARQQFLGKLNDQVDEMSKKQAAFEKTLITAKEKELYNGYKDALKGYVALREKAVELGMAGKTDEVLGMMRGEGQKATNALAEAIQKMVESKIGDAKETSTTNEALAGSAIVTMIVVIGIGVACAVVLGLTLARVIGKPVRELAVQAETVATGDLTVEVVARSKDEIGQLAESFKRMVENLRSTINQVGEASSAVASASSQISSSTEEMAAGAQEQTSQANEVASAVEEMTKTIIENSKNAGTTAETAKQAKEVAEHGGQVVEQTVEGMKRIAAVVNKSAGTVKALGKSSDQIGEIISVIDDIADQTNLLALNAAIEAARAGEQGRGFAVVADEVRKLAERTTKATKEIATMIRTIQTDTADAVRSMEEGTAEVDSGIKLADQAGMSLREIVETAQKVTDMVAQIAAASEQQSSASEQISKNVEAISSVTNQSATGTQQIARAADDLNHLTENLQKLVSNFKLSGGSTQQKASGEKAHAARRKRAAPLKEGTSTVAVRASGILVANE